MLEINITTLYQIIGYLVFLIIIQFSNEETLFKDSRGEG